ncbi:MAG: ATP-binding protein [Deltaproteobacteria bacterium]|nr:ATP-binding protein [Deltaproteobacteria bacterium]
MEKISRIFKVEKDSFFLLGPRGTGKSTMIKEHFPGALYVDLLLPDTYRAYLARPERLRDLVHGNPGKKVIVVDEVQKVPELLDVVHSLMEEKKGLQFVLTGSSARKLKKTGADLLAGRAIMKRMHPFIAAELKESFNFETSLRYGMMPVILDSGSPQAALEAYIDLYIREEVQMEGLTRNMGNFSRFLETASFSHGSIINVSNISRECSVERKVVEGYIQILEDILLAFRLPVFTKRAKRATIQHPKFYFYDTGIYNALRPSGPLDRPEEIGGAALEGLVAQHIRAWIDYRKPDCRLYFWRTSSGSEVDFIVYGKDIFWAIEVKNSAHVNPGDLRPLKAFGEDYPEAKKIFVYRGRERLLKDGIQIEPCEEFLFTLK